MSTRPKGRKKYFYPATGITFTALRVQVPPDRTPTGNWMAGDQGVLFKSSGDGSGVSIGIDEVNIGSLRGVSVQPLNYNLYLRPDNR